MRKILVVIFVSIVACEGRLSDEQRKNMREQMELHKIKRVTEVEINEAAYTEGRKLIASLGKINGDSSKIDSVVSASNGKVRWIVPGKGNALALEQQLVDAYLADESGSIQDNVQKLRTGSAESDSLLYTKPVVTKLPDGSERLEGIWNIWLSKKQLILEMGKK
jgi:hypothetical protein